jgi:Holliday junction resolvase RusA-like endonuclease
VILLDATIPGIPVPQGRARIGRHGHVMDPASRAWRTIAVQVLTLARVRARIEPIDAIVAVEIDVVTERPESRPRLVAREVWATGERCLSGGRGDPDNFAKAALDACVDAGVLKDDHTVAVLTVRKWYAAKGEAVGVRVIVRLDAAPRL